MPPNSTTPGSKFNNAILTTCAAITVALVRISGTDGQEASTSRTMTKLNSTTGTSVNSTETSMPAGQIAALSAVCTVFGLVVLVASIYAIIRCSINMSCHSSRGGNSNQTNIYEIGHNYDHVLYPPPPPSYMSLHEAEIMNDSNVENSGPPPAYPSSHENEACNDSNAESNDPPPEYMSSCEVNITHNEDIADHESPPSHAIPIVGIENLGSTIEIENPDHTG